MAYRSFASDNNASVHPAIFDALLKNDLWLQNARHANEMAALLEREVSGVSGVELVRPREANALFARLPRRVIEKLQSQEHFYAWDETVNEVRWMTAFDTTPEDVSRFVTRLEHCIIDENLNPLDWYYRRSNYYEHGK